MDQNSPMQQTNRTPAPVLELLRNGQILFLLFLTGCSLIWTGWKSAAFFARTLQH